MKHLLMISALIYFGVCSANSSEQFCHSGKTPKLQIGVGTGYSEGIYADYTRPGISYLMTLDYRISKRWTIGLQHQLGIHKQEFAIRDEYYPLYTWIKNGYYTLKDINVSLMVGRSFFKNQRLKVSTGIGFGAYENVERIHFIDEFWDGNPQVYYYDKIYRVKATIPLKIDYKVCSLGPASINISAGTYLDLSYYHSLYMFLHSYYVAPNIKFRL